jgi:hypothetical protein
MRDARASKGFHTSEGRERCYAAKKLRYAETREINRETYMQRLHWPEKGDQYTGVYHLQSSTASCFAGDESHRDLGCKG